MELAATEPASSRLIRSRYAAVLSLGLLNSSFDKQLAIGAWMSGYWNAQRNMETLDVTRFRDNSKRVSDYCKKHKRVTLMITVQKVARY